MKGKPMISKHEAIVVDPPKKSARPTLQAVERESFKKLSCWDIFSIFFKAGLAFGGGLVVRFASSSLYAAKGCPV
jgi:hypothetical protein